MHDEENKGFEIDALAFVIKWGATITTGISGAIIELSVPGAPGMVIAGIGSSILANTLQSGAEDLIQRRLSRQQKARIGTTLYFAAQTIKQNLQAGKTIRQDSFFDRQLDDRSTAEEIIDAVVNAAQQEHSHKKLQLYGRLLANISFRTDIDRGLANQLIGYGQYLSYRQLCLLGLFQSHRDRIYGHMKGVRRSPEESTPQESIKLDLYDLVHKGLLRNSVHPINQLDSSETHYVYGTSIGVLLSELMGLEELMLHDKERLLENLPRTV